MATAGFDVVIVETVGVGQSEDAVASMVDTQRAKCAAVSPAISRCGRKAFPEYRPVWKTSVDQKSTMRGMCASMSTTAKYGWKLYNYNWNGAAPGEHTLTAVSGRLLVGLESLVGVFAAFASWFDGPA